MKRSQIIKLVLGIVIIAAGIFCTALSRSAGIVQDAPLADTLPFAASLILTVLGLVLTVTALIPERKPTETKTLVLAAMFAALCYVGFAVFKIDIPVGSEKTAFHLGNVFCVLAALMIGPFWGGMAGAVGLTLADLMTGYVTSAPKTFVLKLGIGLITGFVAHTLFRISRENSRKVPWPVATVISCIAGMGFNVVADPVAGYFYKTYIMGVHQDAAKMWAKMGAMTTIVNAVIAVIAASVLYLALRPALKKTRLLPKL